MITAPILTCARHRILSDGDGVTTLVLLQHCPLRCRWCINPYSYSADTKHTDMTPEELYEKVKIDNLYFLATNGGITFGGGEPLLYPDFIAEFCRIRPEDWRIRVETSLSVPFENVQKVAPFVDTFFIDCKDVNPEIYRRYTGRDNRLMLDNLKELIKIVPPEKLVLRIPLIPEFNTPEDQKASRDYLESLGITRFDEFEYDLPEE